MVDVYWNKWTREVPNCTRSYQYPHNQPFLSTTTHCCRRQCVHVNNLVWLYGFFLIVLRQLLCPKSAIRQIKLGHLEKVFRDIRLWNDYKFSAVWHILAQLSMISSMTPERCESHLRYLISNSFLELNSIALPLTLDLSHKTPFMISHL